MVEISILLYVHNCGNFLKILWTVLLIKLSMILKYIVLMMDQMIILWKF